MNEQYQIIQCGRLLLLAKSEAIFFSGRAIKGANFQDDNLLQILELADINNGLQNSFEANNKQ